MIKREKTEAALQREALWRDRLERYAASGKKASDFCRAEGIPVWSFYSWRQRLARHAEPRVEKEAPVAPFLDWGALTSPAPSMNGLEIRLDLGAGLVSTIARR
ncbi:IS66 family insertion sequence hypothetical protein [Dyella sp. M7H15-1]|uniref:IS66 family insertion sequence element accessory protein TnpA n=1 Tax=Dyella sp. M7H15-1 TaxID=2501295 RepID=UPI00100513EA|nr:hypothetical protein [Dyella sp. M7H15-1]QAU23752.1 IS66 family insertion sequence hypothetical protein [Dyella sp. M7H15-1]QAU23768.1 IS66 family insertion sequence hypothetical protein [Dyella sp. M7H15-1]